MCVGVLLLNLVACGSDDDDLIGNWVSAYDVDPGGRSGAVSVSVNNIGYFGTGFNDNNTVEYYNDWWSYNPDTKVYLQLADFPGVARHGAVAFTINNKIYVGTGYDGSDRLKDFYEYSIASDKWSKIADFPGVERYGAVAFVVNNKGYVGTGMTINSTYLKDFYCYDPNTSEWTISTSYGGTKRTEAVAFVIDNVAYVVTGRKSGYIYDFWKFDGNKNPDTVEWEQLRDIYDTDDDNSYDNDYDDIVRYGAVSFVCDGKGYITTGGTGGTGTTTWEYTPSDDTWNEKTEFEGTSRGGAISFSLNDTGYLLTGSNSSTYFSDIWYFQPDAEQDDDDNGGIVY